MGLQERWALGWESLAPEAQQPQVEAAQYKVLGARAVRVQPQRHSVADKHGVGLPAQVGARVAQ
jgi:hypothetical protein